MAEETLDITAEGAAALGTRLTRALSPRAIEPGFPALPDYDDKSTLQGGKAWVYRVPGNEKLTKP